FLCQSLEALAKNLETLGGRLIIRQGSAGHELKRLIEESSAVALYFNADPDPFGKAVEQQVEKLCTAFGIECHRHDDISLHTPGEILTQSGQPYRVFTPYSRNWLEQPKPSPRGKPKS